MTNAISGVYWYYQNSLDRAVYIGSSQDIHQRHRQHSHYLKKGKHSNPILQRTWNKYGESDFQFMILELVKVDRLIEREQYWMDALSPSCNIAVAGHPSRGRKMSDEGKLNLSKKFSGRMIPSLRGKKHTDEHRQNISKGMKGKKNLLGYKHTLQSRSKMSMALSGKKKSPEHIRKITEKLHAFNRGRKLPAWHVAALSESRKKFYSNPENLDRMRRAKAVLSDETVIEIWRLATNRIMPQRVIADKFGVDLALVSKIKNGLAYKHVIRPDKDEDK